MPVHHEIILARVHAPALHLIIVHHIIDTIGTALAADHLQTSVKDEENAAAVILDDTKSRMATITTRRKTHAVEIHPSDPADDPHIGLANITMTTGTKTPNEVAIAHTVPTETGVETESENPKNEKKAPSSPSTVQADEKPPPTTHHHRATKLPKNLPLPPPHPANAAPKTNTKTTTETQNASAEAKNRTMIATAKKNQTGTTTTLLDPTTNNLSHQKLVIPTTIDLCRLKSLCRKNHPGARKRMVILCFQSGRSTLRNVLQGRTSGG